MKYRQPLYDTLGIAPGTIYYKVLETPSQNKPIKQIVYRTWRGSQRLYEITGYDHKIELLVTPGSLMETTIESLQRSPNTKALDLLVSTLQAQTQEHTS